MNVHFFQGVNLGEKKSPCGSVSQQHRTFKKKVRKQDMSRKTYQNHFDEHKRIWPVWGRRGSVWDDIKADCSKMYRLS